MIEIWSTIGSGYDRYFFRVDNFLPMLPGTLMLGLFHAFLGSNQHTGSRKEQSGENTPFFSTSVGFGVSYLTFQTLPPYQ